MHGSICSCIHIHIMGMLCGYINEYIPTPSRHDEWVVRIQPSHIAYREEKTTYTSHTLSEFWIIFNACIKNRAHTAVRKYKLIYTRTTYIYTHIDIPTPTHATGNKYVLTNLINNYLLFLSLCPTMIFLYFSFSLHLPPSLSISLYLCCFIFASSGLCRFSMYFSFVAWFIVTNNIHIFNIHPFQSNPTR